MSIWFFVMLIVAGVLVLGPISMLRPSASQRRKEQLRVRAHARGIRFTMRRLPALKTDTEQRLAMPVYYLPPKTTAIDVPEWILMRTPYEHEGNFHRDWAWQTPVRPNERVSTLLKIYLPRLPQSVAAISHGPLGICVFWSEKAVSEKTGSEKVDLERVGSQKEDLEKEAIEILDLLIEMLIELNSQLESDLPEQVLID